MKCIAIIPARIGSKSIKKKNLVKINGISIIEKTILSLKKNKFLSCIAVSTDSKEIQKVAKKNNVWCEKLRPKNISGDKSTANDAVKFVIKAIEKKYDFIFEVHPTYFFRNHLDLYKCFKKVKKQKLRNIISVSKVSSCAHKDYQTSIKRNKIKLCKQYNLIRIIFPERYDNSFMIYSDQLLMCSEMVILIIKKVCKLFMQ